MTTLELSAISKSYGPTHALQSFSLSVHAGEIVALVGENGAGKSTLAKILAGAEKPDSGNMSLDGSVLKLSSPRDALRVGIGIIPQELAPVPTLTVGENLWLGAWPQKYRIYRQQYAAHQAVEVFNEWGFAPLDMGMRARDASTAELQILEVAKALRHKSRVLVFDEPTASLSGAEALRLQKTIQKLSGNGLAVVYISHRMDEVFAFSTRICVLRNGVKVSDRPTSQTARETVVLEMVGHHVTEGVERAEERGLGEEVLAIEHCHRHGRPNLHGVALVLHSREIVALYGLRGSGAETLAAVLAGHTRADIGTLRLHGRTARLPSSPRAARGLGIAYVPPDRKTQGLALGLGVSDNVALPNLESLNTGGIVSLSRLREMFSRVAEQLRIRISSPRQRVRFLSGGNQQKALLAGRLAQGKRILILQEPTRGVDVGSRADIHESLRSLVRDGAAVVLVSSDIEEVVSIATRVVVFKDGRITGEFVGPSITKQAVADAAISDAVSSERAASARVGRVREGSL